MTVTVLCTTISNKYGFCVLPHQQFYRTDTRKHFILFILTTLAFDSIQYIHFDIVDGHFLFVAILVLIEKIYYILMMF